MEYNLLDKGFRPKIVELRKFNADVAATSDKRNFVIAVEKMGVDVDAISVSSAGIYIDNRAMVVLLIGYKKRCNRSNFAISFLWWF